MGEVVAAWTADGGLYLMLEGGVEGIQGCDENGVTQFREGQDAADAHERFRERLENLAGEVEGLDGNGRCAGGVGHIRGRRFAELRILFLEKGECGNEKALWKGGELGEPLRD